MEPWMIISRAFESSLNASVRPNGQSMLMALNGTFHLAIDCQVFPRENLTLHGYVLTQRRGSAVALLRVMSL